MKVLLLNGSPHPGGCTYTALTEAAVALSAQGIETEIVQIGAKPVSGCLGCGKCHELGRCVINDNVNPFVDQARTADGFLFGSPVHYAAASGAITSFLDRAFYSGAQAFAYKPGAAIVNCRRGGASATFDQLNKYFTINRMPVASSQYWNTVHGNTPDQVRQDLEGMQIMRTLGSNLVWLLRCIESGRAAGIAPPEPEPPQRTNFIR